jgi:hypothetical protein
VSGEERRGEERRGEERRGEERRGEERREVEEVRKRWERGEKEVRKRKKEVRKRWEARKRRERDEILFSYSCGSELSRKRKERFLKAGMEEEGAEDTKPNPIAFPPFPTNVSFTTSSLISYCCTIAFCSISVVMNKRKGRRNMDDLTMRWEMGGEMGGERGDGRRGEGRWEEGRGEMGGWENGSGRMGDGRMGEWENGRWMVECAVVWVEECECGVRECECWVWVWVWVEGKEDRNTLWREDKIKA